MKITIEIPDEHAEILKDLYETKTVEEAIVLSIKDSATNW